jgi:hypothetical protein
MAVAEPALLLMERLAVALTRLKVRKAASACLQDGFECMCIAGYPFEGCSWTVLLQVVGASVTAELLVVSTAWLAQHSEVKQ